MAEDLVPVSEHMGNRAAALQLTITLNGHSLLSSPNLSLPKLARPRPGPGVPAAREEEQTDSL